MPRTALQLNVCLCLAAVGCSPEEVQQPPLARELAGNITVSREADLAGLRHVARIDGSLIVRRSTLERLELPDLLQVTGDLRIQKNPKLGIADLGSLLAVGGKDSAGQFVVENNGALVELGVGSLAAAAGGVLVRANPRLSRIDLRALESASGQGIEIASADGVLDLSLGRLESVSRLLVESCHRLARLDLGALAEADAVWILANPSLREIVVPAAAIATGDGGPPRRPGGKDRLIRVFGNSALPNCEALRLRNRLSERGFGGTAELCDNKPDTCPPEGCPKR